jgi:hypothetical protein
LLTVSISDLKPNPQDTSAFYLKNIYEIFGNPNASYPSIPSSLAKPTAFSPPTYAIWVNSLWFLSLTVSLWGAVVATLFRHWAVQYISLVQQPLYTPEKRARIRAIFAKGNPGPYTVWGTGDELDHLHLSLLLFFTGSLIYLFNINRAVFYAVVWWVGYMTVSYAGFSGGFSEPHDLLHTPLSLLALRIYLGISYVVFRICSCLPPLHGFRYSTMMYYRRLSSRYSKGYLIGKRRRAKEIASGPSREIDTLVLERILLTLNEDSALESFFSAIPGFCSSVLCDRPLDYSVQEKLRGALDGFLNRTFSSGLISESVRTGRLITCLNAAYVALGPEEVLEILDDILKGNWDEALQSVEIWHALGRWDNDRVARRIVVACIIARTRRRDDRWTILVKETFGVPDGVLRDNLADDNSVLLSILIHISRPANRARSWDEGVLSLLSKFDIHNTLPGLKHDFCTLWNEIVQEARNQGPLSVPAQILDEIRHLYDALHQRTYGFAARIPFSTSTHHLDQGTDATPAPPIPFSTSAHHLDQGTDATPPPFTSTGNDEFSQYQAFLHPLCDIASHRPDFTTHGPVTVSETVPPPTQQGDSPDASPHQSTLGSIAPRRDEGINIISGLPSPPDPSTTSEIGGASQVPTATFPVHSSSPSSDRSLQDGVATAQPGATSTTTLSRPLKCNKQADVAIPCAAPLAEIDKILFTLPTPLPTPVPVPASTPPILKPIAAYDASHVSMSKPLHPASSSDFSAPDSSPSPPVPPAPNAELLSLLGGTSPEDPSDDSTQPRLHPRRLVDNENMCLENAVPRLLVYCPPFRELSRDMGQLMGQREGKETDGGATPLMDATVRFLDEFAYKEKSSLAQQDLEQAPKGKAREDNADKEENDDMDPLIPTYAYDAMEKRQFVNMKVRSYTRTVAFCH